ncbi:Maf family protein [Sphingomonas sp.]|uniref:Maf family protein n=1 Tax=Sphingomonas sp. TaxID=28214 RepID=UPI0025E80A11|nr:Maf family protein [Sphingomonas sp.]MBV9527548.1 Maf family protein [Sphingomonas sp.]
MGLILASGSEIRHTMLEAAGVSHRIVRPEVEEDAVKQRFAGAEVIATELAATKALAVSVRQQGDWVIGSDSVVSVGDRLFDKPANRGQAADHLRFFSGKAMRLTSAVALARGGSVDWRHVESSELRVRPLSDAFIADYLDAEWPEVGYCVGVFRMEARGVQLFSSIAGSHFTILGMPLLSLLGALRERGLLPS